MFFFIFLCFFVTIINMLLFLIFCLLALNRRYQQRLQTSAILLNTAVKQVGFSNIKRYSWKLQANKRRAREVQRCRQQPPRNQGDILAVDVYEHTGLFSDQFEELYLAIEYQIKSPRYDPLRPFPRKTCTTSLSPRFRLLLCLDYLRNGPKYKRFSYQYKVCQKPSRSHNTHMLRNAPTAPITYATQPQIPVTTI